MMSCVFELTGEIEAFKDISLKVAPEEFVVIKGRAAAAQARCSRSSRGFSIRSAAWCFSTARSRGAPGATRPVALSARNAA
jgi:ABC-type taurine transport system ATPase subunit